MMTLMICLKNKQTSIIILYKAGDLKAAKELYKKANNVHPEAFYDAMSHLAVAPEKENRLDSALIISDSLSIVTNYQMIFVNHLVSAQIWQ